MSNEKPRLQLELKIKQEYSNLVPPLTIEEFAELKRSIEGNGQYLPIIVNSESYILDGHHRFKVCQELHIDPIIELKEFKNELYEKLFVIDSNLKRRHLILAQRIKLALNKKPILQEIAKQISLQNLKQNKPSVQIDTVGRVNEVIASDAGTSARTISKYVVIQEKASKEDKTKVDSGKKSIDEVYNTIQKEQKKQVLLNEKPVIELPGGCDLRLGSFRDECKDIPDNSIDLIFTDPPYAIEYLPVYKDLAVLAERVLKPGGSLLTFFGQYALPKFLKRLEVPGLEYNWIICVKHGGAHSAVHPSKVFNEWKPMSWFTKGETPNTIEYLSDFIQSQQPEKALHPWAQSTVEAGYIIGRLTVRNQIILDPFMGSGTTGIAALKLKRKFIGIEIDEERFKIAKARIAIAQEHTS